MEIDNMMIPGELTPILEGSESEEINYNLDELRVNPKGLITTIKGRFVKGVSGNPKGRPKKVRLDKIVKQHQEILEPEILLAQKTGKAVIVKEALLKTAKTRYELDKISTQLAPYQSSKMQSLEIKNVEVKRVEIHVCLPEQMATLETIYKQNPKIIENLSDKQLKDVTNNTLTIESLQKEKAEKVE